MRRPIDKITLKGFKSIEALEEFQLGKLNVLIGANGAGKSNFVDFFRMLRTFADEAFQQYVNEAGGGDGFFFLGPKVTPSISSRIQFGENTYEFELKPTASGSIQFINENVEYRLKRMPFNSGGLESVLRHGALPWFHHDDIVAEDVYESVASCTVYHFHDTSPLAPMRRDQPIHDWEPLRHDASNVAAFLLHLKYERGGNYELIRDTIRLIAPFFNDFLFRPQIKGINEQVRLEWRQKGSDFPFQPNQFSDGTIRFICLAIALLQPNPPATIVIDEPELGLHPYAISMLADLIKSAAERTQVIISTQSPALLDNFEPSEIVVVNRNQGRSTFERLDGSKLIEWLEDYTLGELWQKNVVRGGPTHE